MWLGGRLAAVFLVLATATMAATAFLATVLAATPAEAAQNCRLTGGGDVYCDGGAQPIRVQVTGKVVQLAASGDSTCALTEPGEVYCWGADEAAAEPDDSGGIGFSPLLLISVGLALVGGGFTLIRLGGQGGRPRADRSASRWWAAASR
jgi:Regulator of chromosome condensation (RCC1) repeat